MPSTTLEFSDFGGLDLRPAPDALGNGALDLFNVDLDVAGNIRSRSGFAKFTGSALASPPLMLGTFDTSVLAWCADLKIRAINSSGTVITTSGTTKDVSNFVNFGAPGAHRVYFGSGTVFDRLTKFDGTTFTDVSPTTTGAGPTFNTTGFVAVTPWDNRLVIAGNQDGITRFSNEGDPETFDKSNYLYLTPGDGENYMGAVAWREFVFVFKESRFFVFYGTSTADDGGAIFNYRTVEGQGVTANAQGAVCVGPDGVYFIGQDGVYRTTGGQAQKISPPLDPLFGLGPVHAFYGDSAVSLSSLTYKYGQPAWYGGRLYVPVSTGQTYMNRVLVLTDAGWLVWNVPAAGMVTDRSRSGLYFGYGTGTNDLGKYRDLTLTTDAGSAIVSRYRSGFYDFGLPTEKTVRESILWGAGAASFQMSRDFGSLDTAGSLSFSGNGSQQRRRTAIRGTTFSHQISASSGSWSVQRLQQVVRSRRPATTHTTA